MSRKRLIRNLTVHHINHSAGPTREPCLEMNAKRISLDERWWPKK